MWQWWMESPVCDTLKIMVHVPMVESHVCDTLKIFIHVLMVNGVPCVPVLSSDNAGVCMKDLREKVSVWVMICGLWMLKLSFSCCKVADLAHFFSLAHSCHHVYYWPRLILEWQWHRTARIEGCVIFLLTSYLLRLKVFQLIRRLADVAHSFLLVQFCFKSREVLSLLDEKVLDFSQTLLKASL